MSRTPLALLLLVLLAGCQGKIEMPPVAAGPEAGSPLVALHAPARATFQPVGEMLIATCGTLDCHGQIGRNLRFFGARGLRLAPQDNPGDNATTAREYDEDYFSLIGLEPELLSDVIADGGARPERLSLVRKARALDAHKGGRLMVPGDPRDLCLLSWLAGPVDTAACATGKDVARPMP